MTVPEPLPNIERPMKTEASVLFLGSSLFTFSDIGPSGTIPSLVSRELASLQPDTRWTSDGFLLFHSPGMLDRAANILAGAHPDAVVVDHSAFQFLHEAVLIRIRNRWPRIYPAADGIIHVYKRACGGNYEGGDSKRGRLFTLSREAALRVIGGDLEVTPEQAVLNSTRVLDLLLAREDVAVISRDPVLSWYEPPHRRLLVESRLSHVSRGLREYCERRHIPRYDLQEELGRHGSAIRMHPDLIHYSLETRQEEARIIAPMVLAALAG